MIHQKIYSLRKSKNLSHDDMAERLGISRSAYGRLEAGEAKLDVDRLKQIAQALDVPAEDLLNTELTVFHFHQNNSGGANGYHAHWDQHFPEEFLQRLTDRYEAHVKELQQMNARLMELLEKKLG